AAEIIFKSNDVAVMVGGTGLYIDAFCNGIDEIPAIDEDLRKNILLSFETNGIEWLQDEIEKKDPEYFKTGEIKNPQRLLRALEVKLSTGQSITEYQKKEKKKTPFKIIKIGLELPKEQLHHKINERTDAMMQQGLLDEVISLMPFRNLNALNTVGYRELFAHLTGQNSLEESIAKIKLNTRHYAKRQLTWFKKDKEVNWINATTDDLSFIKMCTGLCVS
ncbi:MAG: tRNA (adenosine(37)-N6)-dimethylallyltransferase MiaA, partial [Ginsengibacter sp.]